MTEQKLKIDIVSFSYKSGFMPKANLLFDVRFIDNPYWVEKLRPLTGLDKNVQDFVLEQKVVKDFLAAFKEMAKLCILSYATTLAGKTGTASEIDNMYTIAFGCTGGQHRSVAIVEQAACLLNSLFPQYAINIWHRELDERRSFSPISDQRKIRQ